MLIQHAIEAVDFNPWTDMQPENRLTEQFVKSGYELPPTDPKNTTARFVLWPTIKENTSTQGLFNILAEVRRRRQHIRDTSPSPTTQYNDPRMEATLELTAPQTLNEELGFNL
jgi:hypothetical protein